MPSKKPFYGWVITGELAITQMISWGILYFAFSVVLTPMEQSLGWSREQLTGAFSLALLLSGLSAVPIGWWLDRHGARLLMTLGIALSSGLVLAWSAVETLELYYAIWFMIGIMMAAVLYDPAFVLLAKWFHRRRSTALTIVTLAAGFASTIFLPLTDWLVHAQGWRGALVILAIALFVLVFPAHALILRRRPEDLGLLPDGEPQTQIDGQAMQTPVSVSLSYALHDSTFWFLTLAFALALLASNAMRIHLIPYLIDRNYDPSFAAWVGAVIGIAQVVGRITFVPLEARFSPRTMAIILLILQAGSFALLLLGDTLIFIWAFVFIYGAALGMLTLVRPVLTAEAYGVASFGKINSVMSLIMTLAVTVGPFGASFVYERMGGYLPVLMLMVIISLIGVVLLLRVPRHIGVRSKS
jgi:MFS family permease